MKKMRSPLFHSRAPPPPPNEVGKRTDGRKGGDEGRMEGRGRSEKSVTECGEETRDVFLLEMDLDHDLIHGLCHMAHRAVKWFRFNW